MVKQLLIIMCDNPSMNPDIIEDKLHATKIKFSSVYISDIEQILNSTLEPDVILLGVCDSNHEKHKNIFTSVQSEFINIPVIAIASSAETGLASLHYGADDYLLIHEQAYSFEKTICTAIARCAFIPKNLLHQISNINVDVALKELQVAASQQADILNAIPAHIALLNSDGIIIGANDAWKKFGEENNLKNKTCCIGESYFTPIAPDSGDNAQEIYDGIKAVINGTLQQYSIEYPCHSPSEKRWFNLIASPLSRNNDKGAVVMHVNITDRKLVEESLSRAQANLVAIFDNTDDAFILIDKDLRLMAFNRQAQHNIQQIFGSEYVVGASFLQYIKQDDHEGFIRHLEAAAKGKMVHYDLKYVVANSFLWFHIKIKAIKSFDDKLIGFNISGHNYTEQKIAEIKLKQSEERFRALIENSGDMFAIAETDGTLKYVSPSIERILGYKQLKEKTNVVQFIHPDEMENYRIVLNDVKEHPGKLYHHINRIKDRNGNWLWVEGSIINLSHINAVQGIVSNFRDITIRRTIETELKQSQYFLEKATAAAQLGYWIVDLQNGGTITWSAQTYKIYGVEPHNFNPTLPAFYNLVYPDDLQAMKHTIEEATQKQRSYKLNHRCIRPDGTIRWIHVEAEFSFNSENIAILMVGIAQDVTEVTLKEEAIRKSKSKLDALINSTDDFVWSIDTNGKLIAANTAYKQMIQNQYNRSVEIGDAVLHDPPFWQEKDVWIKYYKAALSGQRLALSIEGLEGNAGKYYDLRLNPIMDGDKLMGVSCYCRDITSQKENEKVIRAINEQYEMVSRATNDAVWDWNIVTNEVRWNNGLENLFGYTFGKTQNDFHWWRGNIHPDDEAPLIKSLEEGFARHERNWSRNYRFKTADGSYKYVFARGYIVYEGEIPTRMIGSIQDIHELTEYRMSLEQKVRERTKELNQSLEKEKELADMKSRFVSMASHEFRTPLATIDFATGFLQSYRHKIKDEEISGKLHTIEKQVLHMTSLLDDVLVVGKSDAGKISVVKSSIKQKLFIDDIIKNVHRASKSSHEIMVAIDTSQDIIETDEKLLQNILTNLLSNAIKFSSGNAPVYFTYRENNTSIYMEVVDDGIGIPEKDLDTIFEPFNRGSNVETISGTGLGLTIVKKAVDLLDGQINVTSNDGRTCFAVTLPLKD